MTKLPSQQMTECPIKSLPQLCELRNDRCLASTFSKSALEVGLRWEIKTHSPLFAIHSTNHTAVGDVRRPYWGVLQRPTCTGQHSPAHRLLRTQIKGFLAFFPKTTSQRPSHHLDGLPSRSNLDQASCPSDLPFHTGLN